MAIMPYLVIFDIFYYCLIAGTVVLLGFSFITYVITKPYPEIVFYEEEKYFFNPKSKTKTIFPDLNDSSTINLSVIVPAYNEENRLPPMLEETLQFLHRRTEKHSNYKYEVIIVSDGSKDNTVSVADKFIEKYGIETVRCLALVKNRGKGGAVRLGVKCSRGALILFADADGATKFEDLEKLEASLKDTVHCDPITELESVSNSSAVVIGSRAHLEKDCLAERSIFRNILMYGFHFLVWLFTVKDIKDTQCGFKLFTRNSAKMCFESLHVNRWAFDVELLYIAQKLNIPIKEVPVRWTEIEGSKITPVLSWIQMGLDLGLIWLKYRLGAWKIKSQKLD